MQNLIDKLNFYKERIEKATVFNRELGELIAIELLDFITRDSEILKKEFYKRFDYLKNLAEDKDFIKLQDDLFNTTTALLKLVSVKEIEEMQKDVGNQYFNKFKTPEPEKKGFLTLLEIYEVMQDKNNYYRLKYRDNTYFSGVEEISIYTHIVPVREQYKQAINILQMINFKLKEDKPDTIEKMEKLAKQFDKLYYELDEKIYKTPRKLHTQQFERFFIFCTQAYEQEGYSLSHKFFEDEFYNNNNQVKLQKILAEAKEVSLFVIRDLIFFLKDNTLSQPIIINKKLFFYPDSGIAGFKGENSAFSFGKKDYVLLNFLYTSKNTPFNADDFQKFCNDKIKIEEHHFKTKKDIFDTISYIKKKLKVKKGEFFPIFDNGKGFVWEER